MLRQSATLLLLLETQKAEQQSAQLMLLQGGLESKDVGNGWLCDE